MKFILLVFWVILGGCDSQWVKPNESLKVEELLVHKDCPPNCKVEKFNCPGNTGYVECCPNELNCLCVNPNSGQIADPRFENKYRIQPGGYEE